MARGKYDRGGLNENDKKSYQLRLSHYLKDYRFKKKSKASETAKELGYATPKYSELESEVKPHGRFVSSLDFLTALASLKQMSLNEFVDYLSPPSETRAKASFCHEPNHEDKQHSKLFRKSIEPLSIDESPQKAENILKITQHLKHLSHVQVSHFESLLKSLVNDQTS